MNITMQLPADWLIELHPQYQLMSSSPAGISRMIVELLSACNDRYTGEVLEINPSEDSEKTSLRVMVYLPEKVARGVRQASLISELSSGQTAKALLYKLYLEKPEQPQVSTLGNPLADVITAFRKEGGKQEIRQEQITLFNCMSDALSRCRIGMVEGSTGVGKSLAEVMAAVVWVEKHQRRCVLTAPTLALVRQLVSEYHKVAEVRAVPNLRVIFGKREFVSVHALTKVLQACPELEIQYPGMTQWLATGVSGPLLDHYTESKWLVANLRELAPDFPTDDLLLGDVISETDPGLVAYREQFEKTEIDDTNEIVMCSHAMLASDMRHRLREARNDETYSAINAEIGLILESLKELSLPKKAKPSSTNENEKVVNETRLSKDIQTYKRAQLDWLDDLRKNLYEAFSTSENIVGRLPAFGALIVDEAHQLESNFANLFSDTLSLRNLVASMHDYKQHGGNLTADSLKQAAKVIESLSKKSTENQFKPLSSNEFSYARIALDNLVTLMKPTEKVTITENTPPERVLALTQIRRGVALISMSLKAGSTRAYLQTSEKRGYPQLYIGQNSVDRVLQLLWASVESAVVVSATLYLRRKDGPSGNYMAGLLQIPQERRAEYPPVEAPWLYKCISSVFTPKDDQAIQLTPPSRLDGLTPEVKREKTEIWLNHVAEMLITIQATAQGGILVLNTNYDVVSGLTRRLEAANFTSFVEAKRGVSIQTQAKKFLILNIQGTKPIWLAVGSAWTGLDIGGHDPMTRLLGLAPIAAVEDNIVTDLVIPRLPFGTNMSLTHLRRIANKNTIPWDILDASFRLLQGLGRLVRRKGLAKNRRIWVLDGRLAGPLAKQRLSLFWNPILRFIPKKN